MKKAGESLLFVLISKINLIQSHTENGFRKVNFKEMGIENNVITTTTKQQNNSQ